MYQKVVIVGHLGRDPEMRFTPKGKAVTAFNVATNRYWTDAEGNKKEETTWFRVSAWGKLAELCNQYLGKGRAVLVEGTVSVSAYAGQSGPAASLELRAETVKFLGGGNGESHVETEDIGVDEEPMPF